LLYYQLREWMDWIWKRFKLPGWWLTPFLDFESTKTYGTNEYLCRVSII
jgi:hypothetical protein